MVDLLAIQLALRSRLLTLTVATTGSTTLTGTSTGYSRASGSFLTDGFAVGMEVAPSGFGGTTNQVVTGVTALTLTTGTDNTADGTASGRSLTVGLPSRQAWENVSFDPTSGYPYVFESFVPAPPVMRSAPYSGGTREDTADYIVQVWTPANTGLGAIRGYTQAILDLFPMGTAVTASTGDQARVRGDTGPWVGGLRNDGPGWVSAPVTIPVRMYSAN